MTRRRRRRAADERLARLEARVENLISLVQEERDARERAAAGVVAGFEGLGSVLSRELRPLLIALARDDAGHRRSAVRGPRRR